MRQFIAPISSQIFIGVHWRPLWSYSVFESVRLIDGFNRSMNCGLHSFFTAVRTIKKLMTNAFLRLHCEIRVRHGLSRNPELFQTIALINRLSKFRFQRLEFISLKVFLVTFLSQFTRIFSRTDTSFRQMKVDSMKDGIWLQIDRRWQLRNLVF